MGKRASASLILLIVLIFISLVLAGTGFYLFQKERAKNVELQTQLEELNTKQRLTEKRLDESRKMASDLQVQLQENRDQIVKLNSDLQNEKMGKTEALAKTELLKADLEQQKLLRQDLEGKLSLAQEDAKKAQDKLGELESKKQELEAKIKELETVSQDVELGKIVVTPEVPAVAAPEPKVKAKKNAKAVKETAPAAGPEGKVLVVNREFNFVVLNMGSKDGIDVGQVFSVYHNNNYIGDVKVEKVHDSMAAAGFVSNDIKNKVSEGDRVFQKVK
jgi:vacuolar-type H+-ATPase subunit I/STV1